MRDPRAGRVAGFGTSVFTEMSRLAVEHKAVNLGQGFPDFPGPDFVKEVKKQRRPGVQARDDQLPDHPNTLRALSVIRSGIRIR